MYPKASTIFTTLFEAQKDALNDETEEQKCELCGKSDQCECEQII